MGIKGLQHPQECTGFIAHRHQDRRFVIAARCDVLIAQHKKTGFVVRLIFDSRG